MTEPDLITLTGLRVFGYHGVFDFERREGQDFVIDVALEIDTRPAAASDQVTDTVHYGELAQALAAVVSGEPVNLIETLCARLAEVALGDLASTRPRSPCTSRRPRSRSPSPTCR